MAEPPAPTPQPRRVMALGASGTIGRATVSALLDRGHEVVCFLRPAASGDPRRGLPERAVLRFGDATDPAALSRTGFRGERFDAVVSCMASRAGAPADAWAVERDAQLRALEAAQAAGADQFVLLSAICVQKPLLEFQKAKLAFEEALIASGMAYSIVRPTAFFKSLSGQVARVKAGKPYLVFGDGRLTACKPIGDGDLAAFLADCLDLPERRNRILPIGGPGPALTPRDQGEALFKLLGREARFRQVPVALLDAIIGGLTLAGRVSSRLRDKAEFARIGRYYATESMLVLNPETGRYDSDATPETGTETLFAYQARLLRGEAALDRGAHAVF
ncbi:MAG: NAD(P)H-binding protein [Rubrimonas sp.]|uniref:NAD(P)H-binding protein n=1 Tax=Rubrimonas sp. TaxID=2036015 RepID=UPI002FDD31B9